MTEDQEDHPGCVVEHHSHHLHHAQNGQNDKETHEAQEIQENGDEDPDDESKKYERRRRALLHWQEMPQHLQFNPYILTGYRPMLTTWGCITSLGYWHNETVNIVTHAIPILYILLTVPQLLPWQSADLRFLAWCHIAGILCPWVGSFLYHLLMNWEKGPSVYYRLLQIDMLGIWVSQSFGAMPMIFATTYCLPNIVRSTLICFYCVLSAWGLYKALTAWSPWERRMCFALPFVMRICLWFLRLSGYGGGDPTTFSHVILQDVVSIFGGAIGALHIPEKWYPGSYDMYLNSHNIMHILVVAAVYFMHVATVSDLTWMSRAKCRLSL